MIVPVNNFNIEAAGAIHSASWKESHRAFCSAEFVEKHTPAAQTTYLRKEIELGKQVFMLIDEIPVGIVSIFGSLIENLYILPEKQRSGYGTQLLHFAIMQCTDTPTLWLLSSNSAACQLYTKNGFVKTGKAKQLNEKLYEYEMALIRPEKNAF